MSKEVMNVLEMIFYLLVLLIMSDCAQKIAAINA